MIIKVHDLLYECEGTTMYTWGYAVITLNKVFVLLKSDYCCSYDNYRVVHNQYTSWGTLSIIMCNDQM